MADCDLWTLALRATADLSMSAMEALGDRLVMGRWLWGGWPVAERERVAAELAAAGFMADGDVDLVAVTAAAEAWRARNDFR